MPKIIIIVALFFVINLYSQNKIEKIEFSTEGYANEPDYELIIYCNKMAIFNARSDNYRMPSDGETIGYGTKSNGANIRKSEVKGTFVTKLKNKNYKIVVDLILSLHDEFAKEKYLENNLHVSVGELIVTYQNGKVHTIYDYGMKGTNSLIKLYTLFDNLRFSQKWK